MYNHFHRMFNAFAIAFNHTLKVINRLADLHKIFIVGRLWLVENIICFGKDSDHILDTTNFFKGTFSLYFNDHGLVRIKKKRKYFGGNYNMGDTW